MIMAEEAKPAKEAKPAEAKEQPAGAPAPGAAAEAKPAKKAEKKKGKRVRTGRKHFKSDVYKFYKVEGGKATASKKPCPRCGAGTWLAEHKGRLYCGRCTYTIFEKRAKD